MPRALINIDKGKLRRNIEKLRQIAASSGLIAVVKADAYGHGISLLLDLLKESDIVAVARVEEALEVRRLDKKIRIICLGGIVCQNELPLLIKNQIDLVVFNTFQIKLLLRFKACKPVNVWMEVETGMNRSGLSIREIYEYADELKESHNVRELNLLSHLGSADDVDSPRTSQQHSIFFKLKNDLKMKGTLANSAGLLGHVGLSYDWIRPGLAIYGISPFDEQFGLEAVMSAYGTVINVRIPANGDAVGYGTLYKATGRKICLVSFGYADGLPRNASKGAKVFLKGKTFPIVGNVSMDSCFVEVDREFNVQIGDKVEIWGSNVSIKELARVCDTIPYEILVKVPKRVERQFTVS